MPETIVLIHGAWLNPEAWEPFRVRYESRGYRCLAPAWPMEDRPVAELRRAPHPALGTLTIGKIVDHYEALIRALPEPPILMGHSFGGLFVQMLLDRGLGSVGVAIDPAAPRGVLPGPNALRGALPILFAWRGWARVFTMTPRQFAWSFAGLLPPDEQRAAYERYAVPAPGRLYFQAALGIGSAVRFRNADRAPLLLISADQDRTVEPAMVRHTFRKYQRSSAHTDFKSFPDRTHLLIATPGWEEVADYALQWAVSH